MARSNIRSRAVLAERLGYSRTQLHSIETGAVEPTARFMEGLEEQERLVGLAGEQNEQPPQTGAQYGGRLNSETPPYLTARDVRVFSDAEIVGLAALLTSNAAVVTAGGKGKSMEAATAALEQALQSRGALEGGK